MNLMEGINKAITGMNKMSHVNEAVTFVDKKFRLTVYTLNPGNAAKGRSAKFLEYLNHDELNNWMNDQNNVKKYAMIVVVRSDGKWVVYSNAGRNNAPKMEYNVEKNNKFAKGNDFNADWKGRYNKKADVDGQ